tara:strand:- start:12734 stop:13069 length:336 start_codon:yes stop_codon:yes gene_type:complete
MDLTLLKSRLETFTGAVVTLERDDHGLSITFDAGPTRPCVGGWAGGTTKVFLPTGAIRPREIPGMGRATIIGGVGAWYDMLDGTGWFEERRDLCLDDFSSEELIELEGTAG